MTDRFESILDESISAMQAGVSIEEVLAEAPDYADELRPLLFAASLLADPKPELIPEERKAALRAQYMAQAAELKPVTPSFGEKFGAVSRIMKRRLTRRAVLNDLLTVSITIILTLAMVVLVLSFVSQDTLPGDFLYGVKRLSENTQLIFTTNNERQAQLGDTFNQRRLDEIEQLVQQKRAAIVQFKGTLETKGENLWVIEGHTVFLPQDMVIKGAPQEGDMVEVIGFLRTNNVLVADTIKNMP